jgi:hypothetical protein
MYRNTNSPTLFLIRCRRKRARVGMIVNRFEEREVHEFGYVRCLSSKNLEWRFPSKGGAGKMVQQTADIRQCEKPCVGRSTGEIQNANRSGLDCCISILSKVLILVVGLTICLTRLLLSALAQSLISFPWPPVHLCYLPSY